MTAAEITKALKATATVTAADAALMIDALSCLIARSSDIADREVRIATYDKLDEAADLMTDARPTGGRFIGLVSEGGEQFAVYRGVAL